MLLKAWARGEEETFCLSKYRIFCETSFISPPFLLLKRNFQLCLRITSCFHRQSKNPVYAADCTCSVFISHAETFSNRVLKSCQTKCAGDALKKEVPQYSGRHCYSRENCFEFWENASLDLSQQNISSIQGIVWCSAHVQDGKWKQIAISYKLYTRLIIFNWNL